MTEAEAEARCARIKTLHPKLYSVALAIQKHEGWFPERGPKKGSRAWRNNNPGNLRPTDKNQPRDADGYRTFSNYYEGFLALLTDLQKKCLGQTRTSLGPTSTLKKLIAVWAPPFENDTESYVKAVAAQTGLDPKTTLEELLA